MEGFKFTIQPDNIDPEAAEILVEANIGKNKYEFLLDTGSARTTIKYDSFTSRFKINGTDKSSGVFAKTVDDLITVPKIILGSITKYNFQVVRMPNDQLERKNLIGMDLLKNYCCEFLFDENFVKIKRDKDLYPKSEFQDLYLDKRSHPYIKIKFPKETEVNAVWDTGAGITVVDLNFIRKYPNSFSKTLRKSQGTDSTGTTMETPMYELKSLQIGNILFSSLIVAGVDFSNVNANLEVPIDIVAGYNLMCKANWLFDFPQLKWTILKTLNQKT